MLLRYQPRAEGGEAISAKAGGLWDRAQQDPERFVDDLINNPGDVLKDIDAKDAAIVAGLAALLVVGKGVGKRVAHLLMGRLLSRPGSSEQPSASAPPTKPSSNEAPSPSASTSIAKEAASATGALIEKKAPAPDESPRQATREVDADPNVANVGTETVIVRNTDSVSVLKRPNDAPGLVARFRKFIGDSLRPRDRNIRFELGPVDNAEWLGRHVGVDLRGYRHTVDSSALRHTINDHGDPEREKLRGQIAVTPGDFELIPQVLQADSFEFGGKTADGLRSIVYRRQIGDTIYYVEEVRTGAKELAMKTMYKKPGGPAGRSDDAEASPGHSSETSQRSQSKYKPGR